LNFYPAIISSLTVSRVTVLVAQWALVIPFPHGVFTGDQVNILNKEELKA
jgi:hypothetical protein